MADCRQDSDDEEFARIPEDAKLLIEIIRSPRKTDAAPPPVAPLPSSSHMDEAKYFFNKGNKFYDNRKFEDAVDMYTFALRYQPNSVEGYYNRGNAFRNLNKFAEAVADYNRALEISPQDIVVLCKKGIALTQMGRSKFVNEGIECFNKAIKITPDCSEAFVKRGNAYRSLGRLDEAIRDYDACIKLPNGKRKYKAESLANWGLILAARSKLAGAVDLFKKAIDYYPAKYDHK